MQRLKLIVAYDGAPFRGWQSQRGGNTIQDILEKAFAQICGERIPVHGSGRTDSGVHALAQCAHADVPAGRLPLTTWVSALNAHLPREIRVLRCSRVSSEFHARYSAKGKIYTYRIWNAPVLSPFEFNRSWHIPSPLDFKVLEKVAKLLTGTHDFAAFAANRGKPATSTVRTIHKIIVRPGRSTVLVFDGNGFLYKMVRLMVGALVRVAQNRAEPQSIRAFLESPHRARCSFVAPAEGLYLTRVRY